MNARHSGVTDWGLAHIAIRPYDAVLDVGCGGGRTISKLAAAAPDGRISGIDYSETSVAASTRYNAPSIAAGRVDIRQASVSELPFPAETFDLVTAVETHFHWPDLSAGMREIFRVLKPGGTVLLVAEIYNGAKRMPAPRAERYTLVTGMTLLTPDEHRDLLATTGFTDIQVVEERNKGWICARGKKP
jgi:ubiquinone/menaquinone biosynthesis C-methylase UbiE